MNYRPYNHTKYDDLVSRIRELLKIEDEPRPNYLEAARKFLPSVFPGFEIKVLPDCEMDRNSGVTNSKKNLITISKSVESGVENHQPEETYVFLEEVAHLIFQHDGVRFRRENDVRARAVGKVRGQEAEAKEVALRLMSPTRLANGCGSIEQLVEKFPLNRRLAVKRMQSLRKERRWATGADLELPKVVNFEREATARGKTINNGAGYKRKFAFQPPTEGLLAILEIDLGSDHALCTVYIYAPGKKPGLVPVDIEGRRARIRLRAAPNEIYIEPRKGVLDIAVAVVDWYDPVEQKKPKQDDRSITSHLLGYTDQPCPECSNKRVKSDGNCKTCDNCGWTNAA